MGKGDAPTSIHPERTMGGFLAQAFGNPITIVQCLRENRTPLMMALWTTPYVLHLLSQKADTIV